MSCVVSLIFSQSPYPLGNICKADDGIRTRNVCKLLPLDAGRASVDRLLCKKQRVAYESRELNEALYH